MTSPLSRWARFVRSGRLVTALRGLAVWAGLMCFLLGALVCLAADPRSVPLPVLLAAVLGGLAFFAFDPPS